LTATDNLEQLLFGYSDAHTQQGRYMRTAFKIWLVLTCISLGLYTPYYLFSNNARDAVEELTLWHYTPISGPAEAGVPYDRIRSMFSEMGFDIDLEFEDALEDNDLLSDIDIDYVIADYAAKVRASSGLRLVKASAEIGRGHTLTMVFAVQDKGYLKSFALVRGMMQLTVETEDFIADLTQLNDTEELFYGLFHKDETKSERAVRKIVASYNILYHDHLMANPRASIPDTNTHASAKKIMTLGDVMEMMDMPTDPVEDTPDPEPAGKIHEVPAGGTLDNAISSLVESVKDETGANEYVDARSVLKARIVGKTTEDAAVLYTMEREIATRYLAVFLHTGSEYQLVANTIVDSQSAELAVENGIISVKTLIHSIEDPMCCPTQEMTLNYRIDGNELVEVPRS